MSKCANWARADARNTCFSIKSLPYGKKKTFKLNRCCFHFHIYSFAHFLYCASDILTCTPALVLVVGALDEMYGITLR